MATRTTRLTATLAGALTVLVVTACGSGTTATRPPDVAATASAPVVRAAAPELRAGRLAQVAVSVATLWRSPDAPRPVDAPALTRPVHIERWLANLTTEERRALNGRADTQALLGDRVRVVRLRPHWAKVVVPDQPTPLDARGYPGWVPRRQLTAVRPVRTERVATVVERTAWLRTDDQAASPLLRVSLGTRLPLAGTSRRFAEVHLPDGAVRRIARSAVVLHDRDAPAVAPTRPSLVAVATSFTGLDYLWAGASGFGVDCSGLTWLTYRVHGIRIPRDASAQAAAGRAVERPRSGDLLFFGNPVHHVAMSVGHSRMVHAPGTGQVVQTVPTSTPPFGGEYVGARRLLP
ncbi:NlpC/P60 family protein [Nocardioides sp.]|uniref:C40 family peptidase n=1 Tax=Nocardioides sp. TaxID=35761 RepID=UPI0037853014